MCVSLKCGETLEARKKRKWGTRDHEKTCQTANVRITLSQFAITDTQTHLDSHFAFQSLTDEASFNRNGFLENICIKSGYIVSPTMLSSKWSQRFLCVSCRRAFATQLSSARRLYSQNRSESSKLNRSGRNVLVTGGSRGIGLAIAEAFIKQGDKLCVVGRNRSSLQSAVDKWNQDTASFQDWQANPRHMFFVGDVGRRDTWSEIVTHLGNMDDADPSWKAPDILVNAAGVSQSSLLIQTDSSSIEDVVQTNLMGVIWGCQSIGKLMVASQRRARKVRDRNNQAHDEQADVEMPSPCIINISSLLALQNGRGSSVYAASKAGILGLTRALAAELGPAGIRVNAIVPGYIETNMTSGKPPRL